MFKIAVDAGHYLKTPGRRVDKRLDTAQTREWVLNDRVARYLTEAAGAYPGVEILRVDDPTGKKNRTLSARCKEANRWGADVYISCHHNAGIRLGSGGGIVAYCYKTGTEAARYRDEIYRVCIAAGGLRGNRSNPTPEKGFYVLRHTKMPAVLMEYGFMDSKTDAPVILTEAYAKAMGVATMEAVAKVAGLEKTAVSRLKEDGKWGKATTARLQQLFGLPADGVVANQPAGYRKENPGLLSGWNWQNYPGSGGSPLIRAMQAWAALPENKQDGKIGPETIRAFQRKLGTPADGKVSCPSRMVRALQHWANTRETGHA